MSSDFRGLEIGGYYKPHHSKYHQMDKKAGGYTQTVADASETWPFPDNSFSVVYASHVVEHLGDDGARAFFNQAYRCLKYGGVLKVAMPDFRKICVEYLKAEDLEHVLGQDRIIAVIMGENYDYLQHRSLWDRKKVTKALTQAGFKNIVFQDVNPRYLEDDFLAVFGRAPYETRVHYELYVEACKEVV